MDPDQYEGHYHKANEHSVQNIVLLPLTLHRDKHLCTYRTID